MVKYQIKLTQNDGSYIILMEDKNKEFVELMLKWYINKSKFFNGVFEITERTV